MMNYHYCSVRIPFLYPHLWFYMCLALQIYFIVYCLPEN